VLESFVTEARDKAAALKFIKKAMKRHGRTRAITTDGLRSYGAALKEIGAADLQEVGRWQTIGLRTATCRVDDEKGR
jgi:putative transposase